MTRLANLDRRRFVTVFGFAGFLAACATATPYQPLSRHSRTAGGYSEERLGPDRWLVTFAGNTLTSRETVEGYMLYRAAELTLQQHRTWFEIIDREMEHEVRQETFREPYYDPWWGYPGWRPYWNYYDPRRGWLYWYPGYRYPFWARGIDTRTVDRYEAHAEILMHSGTKPPGNGRTFDARDVIARLGPTITRPAD